MSTFPFPGAAPGEEPAEIEIAGVIVTQILPNLRSYLAALRGMQDTWRANGLDAKIEAAAAAETTLAGHTPEVWQQWQIVFNSLQTWLETPIEEIGTTPAAVLLKRYPAAG